MNPLRLAPEPPPAPAGAQAPPPSAQPAPGFLRLAYWPALLLVLVAGVALRVLPTATVKGVGFDEILYRGYVLKMAQTGLTQYDLATQIYLEDQRKPGAQAELPPTRFLYIFAGHVWQQLFHGDAPPVDLKLVGGMQRDPALCSLRAISKLFSVLTLLLGAVVAWRLAGRSAALGVAALFAFAPIQVHLSQHAMIDGFFTFWATLALWGLWEALRQPGARRWLLVYGLGLSCLVLTKENSFFVFVALCVLLLVNRATHWGKVTPGLLGTTVLAPALGVLLLVALAGGLSNFIQIYTVLVTNAQHLEYAIETGDGPWYRYLVDLMVMSPVLLCLAVGAALRGGREESWVPYILLFVAATFVVMCNVRYGMNLRYATIWELPLCLLAFRQITLSTRGAGRWAPYLVPLVVLLVCAHEWYQYQVFFKENALYELAPADLLHAVKILK